MSGLKEFVETNVKVITTDGRFFIGLLEGYDQKVNIILSNSKERIFSIDEPTQDIIVGACIIRGDEVVSIFDYDMDEDSKVDYSKIYAGKLKDTKNSLV